MDSWVRRSAPRIVLFAVAAVLAFAGVVLASGSSSSVQICTPSKEGKPIVTPTGGVCKTGYSLTELNKEGREGKEGPQGREGPFPSTLPHGATVTGAFAVTNGGNGGDSSGDWATSAISFPYKLAAIPTVAFVSSGKTAAGCTGSASNPTAESGHLCVYEGISLDVEQATVCSPLTCKESASRAGALVRVFAASGASRWYDWGTWAVTG